jgi:hypothetical protein
LGAAFFRKTRGTRLWVTAELHPLAVETADAYCRGVRYFRLVLWLIFFVMATFCWIVLIEHGPENFFEGTKIEIENLGWFTFRFFK